MIQELGIKLEDSNDSESVKKKKTFERASAKWLGLQERRWYLFVSVKISGTHAGFTHEQLQNNS